MPDYPSGTVAFLFTDIEGSTKRWEIDATAMWTAVERHFALLDEAIAARRGVRFKTIGDAVQAAFHTVPDAVAAAIAAQLELWREDWGALGPLRVRMAIHVGAAEPKDGDYLAPALNRLARVLGTGYGEQILLTEAARALASTLPVGYALQDLGRHRLRDLLEAEHIYQLTGPGLPIEFPVLKGLDRQPNNLPAQPTALIGREDEVAALREMLTAPGTRLVTLTGPGGTGKTRLALQVAAESLDAFPDGVWWVPLGDVSDAALVPEAIAAALGVRESPVEPLLSSLIAHLRSRDTLLILDNMEQVIEAAPHIARLLDGAPELVFLATSRESLRLRAEREYPVDPLPLPKGARVSVEDALASPAVRLFVERAQAIKPGFVLDEANVADVVAIAQRLDGLPLAIELAAARVRVLTPAALLARLDQRLSILTGGARDLPQRQQTLRAAIAWSHDLLEAPERLLFARLGVFAGGCTFEAAEAICSAAGGLPIDLFDGLDSLMQKSLLRQNEGPGGDTRFTMLQTIREFARERFQELPEADELRQLHADLFYAFAAECNWDDVSRQGELLDHLEADHANLRQAIEFYAEQSEKGTSRLVSLVASLSYFWWIRGHLGEGRRLIDRALASPGEVDPLERARALWGAAVLAEAQGDLEQAQRHHEAALALRRQAGDSAGMAESLTGLGVIARQQGELDQARALHREALEAWRDAGDAAGTAGALLDLGVILVLEGDYQEAEPALQESLALFRRLQDESGEASALQSLGVLAMSQADLATAGDRFGESLQRWRALGNQQMIATDLGNLGEALQLGGALDEAERHYREAQALFTSLADPGGQAWMLNQLGLISLDRSDALEARRLLVESLRLRWNIGERGAAADTLDALAEATWRLGDVDFAANLTRASDSLREETGFARQPVYQERYRQMFAALQEATCSTEPLSIEETVAMALGSRALVAAAIG
jgi:predicted ATPase